VKQYRWVVGVGICHVLLLAASSIAGRRVEGEAWRYVGRTDAPPFSTVLFRAIRLTTERPSEMVEKVRYRGTRRFYTQIRYGTNDSARVIVVVDRVSPTEFDLYVDRDRNRTIEKKDLVAGSGRTRTAELEAEILEAEQLNHVPRRVQFRLGVTGQRIGLATLGFIEGRATVAGRSVAVRRVDGDGNGLFSDGADRVWIDLNDDGQWDPITEQFPFRPVLHLDGRRLALRADRLGQWLRFEEILGTGRLKVRLPLRSPKSRVERIEVMFLGDDGSAFSVRSEREAVVVPVGRYAVGAVSLVLRDGASSVPWTFTFSRPASETPAVWHEVRPDQTVVVNPIGRLRFDLQLAGTESVVRPGEAVTVDPRLRTEDGLLINSSFRGQADWYSDESKHNAATVQLVATDGRVLDTARSGFS